MSRSGSRAHGSTRELTASPSARIMAGPKTPTSVRLHGRRKLARTRDAEGTAKTRQVSHRAAASPKARSRPSIEAVDTIHGLHVALKIPHESSMSEHFLVDFKREARLAHRLEHPNILPIRDASFIADRFVIAMPLGERSLASRMRRRLSTDSALHLIEQALAAVAHAHSANVIHCDIKPDNFILFPDNRLKLTDFGFSKVAERTLRASGSGTVGYIAPEQAVGRPKFQSDVFSLGLVIYELLSGYLPEWPYDWPPPEVKRVREKLGAKLMGWLRRAIEVRPENRFKNAATMYREFKRLRNGAAQEAPACALEQGRRSVAVAEGAVPAVPAQVRQVDRGALSLPPLHGARVGAHADAARGAARSRRSIGTAAAIRPNARVATAA